MLNRFYFFSLVLFLGMGATAISQAQNSSLTGKIICLDPGHGGTAETDSYRVGPSGEREEWVNLRVSLLLKEMLEEKGAKVIMTRTGDDDISLSNRAKFAKDNKADLFLSIHHNATADPDVNFPIIYFNGNLSENKASVALGQEIGKAFIQHLYNDSTPVSVVSDYTIFPENGTAVLGGTYGIPGVVAEASFFTNPAEEGRLKQFEHNRQESLGYLKTLEVFFKKPVPPILEKNSKIKIPPFRVFQEAERMNETARLWYVDFLKGKELMKQKEPGYLQEAYERFTRSARSFPDSYIAAECHKYRAVILKKLGKPEDAKQTEKMVREYFLLVDNNISR
jgi:N-acetylmuramoyl-L-alanine amidase